MSGRCMGGSGSEMSSIAIATLHAGTKLRVERLRAERVVDGVTDGRVGVTCSGAMGGFG